MTDRTANPRTPVQFRARPPHLLPEIIGERRERCASHVAHDANEKRTVTGTYAGTALPHVMTQDLQPQLPRYGEK